MSLSGPSRLGVMASLPARRANTAAIRSVSPTQLRRLSCSYPSAKPLTSATEASSTSYDPSIVNSIGLSSSLRQQQARQRISEIDSRVDPPAPSHVLRDRHSRQHTYLRISLTEKCNLRCLYCMPEDGVPLTPSANLLSTSEVERLASLFVSQGVNKIRLTGGEPTVRSDLPQIVSSLAVLKQHGLEQIGITTNGIALGRRKLDTLAQNGLTHLNVSLDTLDPFKFEFMTRRRGHEAVIDCIERALALGLPSVKINVVVIKGLNDTKDVVDFVRFTKDKPITIRFIEYMPFDGNKWQAQKLVPYRDLVKTIQAEFPTFERVANRDDPNDTSKHWRVPGHQGTVGFITSMTDNFCAPSEQHIQTSQRSGSLTTRRHGARLSAGSMTPRRAFHSSSRRLDRSKVKEEDEDDDNPWGDLDKAFENLEDKSLYKQVYLNPTSEPSVPPRTAPSMAKDPIAEMEEAIFAQAGAAAVKGATKPKRNVAMASLSGVKFSDVPPSAAGNGFPMDAASGSWDASVEGASGAKWSEYMQGGHSGGEDDDSPWSSLDAFVDNPESSAQFAVPLHLQSQQDVMQQRAQQHLPRAPSRQQHEHTLGEAFAANNEFLRQQTQLTSEEAMFAQAGAAAVDSISSAFSTPAAIVGQEDFGRLSHIDPTTGGASMVDVSHKTTTCRSATAIGRVYLPTHAAALIRTTESHSGVSGKGPVLHTAQLAGIMAAKRTADLIPLCHPLSLTHVDLKLSLADGDVKEGEGGESWVQVECTARTAGQTGVEMEALTGCTVACLTVWDMAKAVAGKTMRIGEIMVVKKSGGKSGDWQRTP